jgi:hypothetical protein
MKICIGEITFILVSQISFIILQTMTDNKMAPRAIWETRLYEGKH